MPIVEKLTFRGIEGVRVGRYPFMVNSMVWFYRVGQTLLDCGSPNQRKHVMRYAKSHNVKRVLVTHHHEDHSGTSGDLQSDCRAEIFARKESIPALRDGYEMGFYRRFFFGVPRRVEAKPLSEKTILEDGQVIWSVPAPGHCNDHSCFLVANKGCLIAGDLYVTRYPVMCGPSQDPVQEMKSLQAVLKLDFDTVLCGHKGLVKNGKKRLEERLRFLEDIHDKAKAMQATYPELSSTDIRQRLLGHDISLMRFITNGEFSKQNMINRFLAK